MTKPVIFTVSAISDAEANVWSGHCDEIPAAADAPTLDQLLEKVSRMAAPARFAYESGTRPRAARPRHTANATLRQAGLPKAF